MDHAHLADIITALLAQGFTPPLCLCAVDSKGTLIAMRYDYNSTTEAFDPHLIAETDPEGAMYFPINMMVVDARGEAARVVFQFDGWRFANLN